MAFFWRKRESVKSRAANEFIGRREGQHSDFRAKLDLFPLFKPSDGLKARPPKLEAGSKMRSYVIRHTLFLLVSFFFLFPFFLSLSFL